jgi:putative DNA primase/helicase
MTSDIIDQFFCAMQNEGCPPTSAGALVPDDRPRYISCALDKNASKKTIAYCLRIDGDYGVGWFRSFKHGANAGQTIKFVSTQRGKLTPEEKAERKRRVDAAKKEQQQREDARQRRQARMAKRLHRAAQGLPAAESHPYLAKKNVKPYGVRSRRGEIIIPVYQTDGLIWSVQRITSDGGKWFMSGGRVAGGYYPIPAEDGDKATLVIAEGFATAATVREVTGRATICAFNAGNLMAVAQGLRKKYPEARLIIAADNDRFTKAGNVGIEKAKAAAGAVGGFVIYPEFPDDSTVGTDWNDYVNAHGADQLRDKMQRVLAPEAGEEDGYPLDVVSFAEAAPPPSYDHEPHYEMPPQVEVRTPGDFGMDFKVLGYNGGTYYYFPFKARQIVALTASGHTMPNLLQLSDLDRWENRFGGEKMGHQKIATFAANAMIQAAQAKGVFQEESRVRGCGAWIDEGHKILHCGDTLYVDGRKTAFEDFNSHYTYVAASRLMTPSDSPLTNAEAHTLRKICEMPTWENPLSGALLAGWLVVAPICAALNYRPHIYLTGEAESGKSTVLNEIIKPVLGRMAMNVDGGTTEPAIRDMMGHDGRPLVYDEAEPSPGMVAVIELARKASTGSTVKKYGQRAFNARFCACFSAIVPPINKTADESRVSFLVIKKNRTATAIKDYEKMLDLIEATITPDYSNRMIARTLANMDALVANIKTFQRAARLITGGARASQQIGTMIAGLYLLGSKGVATLADAEAWIKKHDWSEHTIIDQQGDPMKLVQHIASSLIRRVTGVGEASVGDLISAVVADRDDTAIKTLRNYGIMAKEGRVYIASTAHNLARLLKDTEWQIKWSRTLSDVPGAQREKSIYFARGVKTSAVSLPLELFTEEQAEDRYMPEPEMELEF